MRLLQDIRDQQARLESVERYIMEGLESQPDSFILVDKLFDEITQMFTKKIGKRQFYTMLKDIVATKDALIQLRHKATLNLCVSGGISVHVVGPACCDNPCPGNASSYRVITNCKWVS